MDQQSTISQEFDRELERLCLALSHNPEPAVVTFTLHCIEFCRNYKMYRESEDWLSVLDECSEPTGIDARLGAILKSIRDLVNDFWYGAIQREHVLRCVEIYEDLRCLGMAPEPLTKELFRPVGPKELHLIGESGWRKFPPRLPEQPIFYPVTNFEYAAAIAKRWNVKDSGAEFVTRFHVEFEYLSQFPIQTVGGEMHKEYWIPAEELDAFNSKSFWDCRRINGMIGG